MTELVPDAGFRKNQKLKSALLQHNALSRKGLSERLFGLLFSGLVYPQIWEDPDVDMQAMQLAAGHRVVTIGSGGCNMLAYLSREPDSIDVVDLNPHHIALNKLKLAAFRHLPDHTSVVRLLGTDNARSNASMVEQYVAPHLDATTRRYWSRRTLTGRRRIRVFNGNFTAPASWAASSPPPIFSPACTASSWKKSPNAGPRANSGSFSRPASRRCLKSLLSAG